MSTLTLIKDSLLHLFYPHVCAGCGTDILPAGSNICVQCIHNLPFSGFEKMDDNPVEKILYGRVQFNKATALLYFTKQSSLQNIMHTFKYRNNKDLGHQLGLIMGNHLLESGRFRHLQALMPLPLHESRTHKRGYNQAEILCNGIAEILQIPVITHAVKRVSATETQTRKSRIERWQNMEGKFILADESSVADKQVLLVDDVITTGATLEACAAALSEVKGVGIYIATLCYADKI